MEEDRKQGRFVKDGESGFYLDKTPNVHFKDGDINGVSRSADDKNSSCWLVNLGCFIRDYI